jgi:hypothetical protein
MREADKKPNKLTGIHLLDQLGSSAIADNDNDIIQRTNCDIFYYISLFNLTCIGRGMYPCCSYLPRVMDIKVSNNSTNTYNVGEYLSRTFH